MTNDELKALLREGQAMLMSEVYRPAKERGYGDFAITVLMAKLDAALAALPQDLVLVTREPTEAMFANYLGRPLLNMDKQHFEKWKSDYKAMLAAGKAGEVAADYAAYELHLNATADLHKPKEPK